MFAQSCPGTVTLAADGPASFPHLSAELVASELKVGALELGPLAVDIALETDPWRDRIRVIPRGLSLFGPELEIRDLAWRFDGPAAGVLDLALSLEFAARLFRSAGGR